MTLSMVRVCSLLCVRARPQRCVTFVFVCVYVCVICVCVCVCVCVCLCVGVM